MTMWANPQIGRGLSSHQSQLPLGWEERFNENGYQYFYDTITNTTALDDPRLGNELGSVLPAWQEETDSNGNHYFTDFTTRCALFLDPPKNPKPLSLAAQAGSIHTTTEATTSE
ncbi:hypothetical protein V5O48_018029, partial [Marasmius crinis-equi]